MTEETKATTTTTTTATATATTAFDFNDDVVMMNIENTIVPPSPTTALYRDWTAEQYLQLGDNYCIDEHYGMAIDAYASAESLLSTTTTTNNNHDLLKFRIVSHRSQAMYQLERYQDAFADAEMACQLLSASSFSISGFTPSQGLFPGESEAVWKRYGCAAMKLQKYDSAIKGYTSALQLARLNQSQHESMISPSKMKQYEECIQTCKQYLQKGTKPTTTKMATTEEDVEMTTTATTTTPAVSVPAPAPAPSPTKPTSVLASVPKYQYYQSDKFMTVIVLQPQMNNDTVRVEFEPKYLTLQVLLKGTWLTVICGKLYDEINPNESKITYKAEKFLVKLRKTKAFEWHELLAKKAIGEKETKKKKTTSPKNHNNNNHTETATSSTSQPAATTAITTPAGAAVATTTTPAAIPRPYASHRDWDSIEKTIEQEEEQEKPQGDDAMNKLFQQIFQNADPDTRRAMIKSYQTSGGTVLSTNWDEVAKTDYEKERTAPKGMEWKNWEGKKLPMKDDD